jgi:hypothetical protein
VGKSGGVQHARGCVALLILLRRLDLFQRLKIQLLEGLGVRRRKVHLDATTHIVCRGDCAKDSPDQEARSQAVDPHSVMLVYSQCRIPLQHPKHHS